MIRRTGFYSKTVEIPLSELPPPPNPIERVRSCLEDAARWASDVGPDVAEAITKLLASTRRREIETKGRAA